MSFSPAGAFSTPCSSQFRHLHTPPLPPSSPPGPHFLPQNFHEVKFSQIWEFFPIQFHQHIRAKGNKRGGGEWLPTISGRFDTETPELERESKMEVTEVGGGGCLPSQDDLTEKPLSWGASPTWRLPSSAPSRRAPSAVRTRSSHSQLPAQGNI